MMGLSKKDMLLYLLDEVNEDIEVLQDQEYALQQRLERCKSRKRSLERDVHDLRETE